MRRLMWAVPVVVVVTVPWVAVYAAQDKPKDDKPQTSLEEFQALTKEFQTAQIEYRKALAAAKTPEERQEAIKKAPDGNEYAKKFLAFAEKNSKDAIAVDALLLTMQAAPGSPHARRAAKLLVDDHIQDEKIAQALRFLAQFDRAEGERAMRLAVEKSPHQTVKAMACYSLATLLKQQAESANGDAAKMREAEAMFERVINEFGDAEIGKRRGTDGSIQSVTYGEYVKGELFELRNLSIGKIAPDIEGEDIDGTNFKLSDYRGKVVVLDFWGHW